VSTISTNPPPQSNAASARRKAAIIVAACTVLNAVAQILFKLAVRNLVPTPLGLLTNLPLIGGLACYGLFMIAMVLALREGELSMLYPIIALSYVWVTLLSYTLLKEPPNLFKNLGITTIVIGVAVLGRGGKK
jgi:drug/metabolite transporter (DMT)-like permease